MVSKRVQTISFLIILLAAFLLAAYLFEPFVNVLAFSIILAILFYPLYDRLRVKLKSENWASIITVVVVLLIILIPILFFGQLIFNELVGLYNRFRAGELVLSKDQVISSLPVSLQNLITDFSRDINQMLARLASNAFQSFSSLLSNVANFVISLFITFFALFYLLRDGKKLKELFMDLSPIATSQENLLVDKIVTAVNGVVKGQFLTAIIQGLVAMIGFFIFGVPEPVVWGLFTIIAALVPTVGTSLSIVPAILLLVITGNVPGAIGLAIWGALAVGLIDNFIGPKLVGSQAKLHPLLVLFSVLGGVQAFGFIGVLMGPIIMAILVALIDIYRTDFKEYLHLE